MENLKKNYYAHIPWRPFIKLFINQKQEKAEQVKNFSRDTGKKKGDELHTWVAALDALWAL